MRKFQASKGREFIVYDSLKEQCDHVGLDRNGELYFEEGGKGDSKFIGRRFDNWQQVLDAVQGIWPQGKAELQRMVEDLLDQDLPEPMDSRRKVKFNEDDGDEIDLDRLREGSAFWRTSSRENTHGPTTMTIFLDLTAHCGVESMDILWRGAAAIALATRLEASGYRCEIWACTGGTHYSRGPSRGISAVNLKRCEDPLDCLSLINAVSGWYFRTIGFKMFEKLAKEGGYELAWGYGQVSSPTEDDLDEISKDEKRVYIAGTTTRHGALQVVEHELAKFTKEMKK